MVNAQMLTALGGQRSVKLPIRINKRTLRYKGHFLRGPCSATLLLQKTKSCYIYEDSAVFANNSLFTASTALV